MKLITITALISIGVSVTLADMLPNLGCSPPTRSDVKERIAPPANSTLYDVWYAKGTRIYQCNPEMTGFQFWYNVQTDATLYSTKGRTAPFDVEGFEIGQLSAAPLDPTQQMANPMDTIPVIYDYLDGSWVGTARPLATTTKEEGRIERGDSIHLDDHIVGVSRSSTNGYLSHARYIVRVNSLNGVVPDASLCTTKGKLIIKPFTSFYLFFTDEFGVRDLATESIEWQRMVEEYTPEKLAAAKAAV
ncbi:hypothetical protein BDB01DRAFT_812444 [Pilobolus umbonatus]|nr:hypothetical protein BDB01DRAFT_812444 [Pilobolus umbonatus]